MCLWITIERGVLLSRQTFRFRNTFLVVPIFQVAAAAAVSLLLPFFPSWVVLTTDAMTLCNCCKCNFSERQEEEDCKGKESSCYFTAINFDYCVCLSPRVFVGGTGDWGGTERSLEIIWLIKCWPVGRAAGRRIHIPSRILLNSNYNSRARSYYPVSVSSRQPFRPSQHCVSVSVWFVSDFRIASSAPVASRRSNQRNKSNIELY